MPELRPPGRGAAIVAIVFSATAVLIGASQYAFSLFIAPLEASFGWSRTEVSASLSFAAVGALAAPFIGRLMDRTGARPVLAGCIALSAISFLLRPLMSELWHWYALSFLQFVGFSGATVLAAGKLIGSWYPHARGRVMGIALMGNNFGGLVMPAAVAAVLAAASWREAYVGMGLAALLIAGLTVLVVRDDPPPGAASTAAPAPGRAGTRVMVHFSRAEALRTGAFGAVALVIVFGTFTYSTILPHVLAHLVNQGLSVASASFALGALAVGGLLGKLAFGTLCDRAGARRTVAFNLGGQALLAVALALLVAPQALLLAAPAFGFFMGGFGVLQTLLVQEFFGLRHFGSIMGLLNAGTVFSAGLGPLLAGLSFDLSGSYAAAFIIVAALFLIAAVALALVPAPVPPASPGEPA